jgi:hypothetical protein
MERNALPEQSKNPKIRNTKHCRLKFDSFAITESMARIAPPEHRMNDRYHPHPRERARTHTAPPNQRGMLSKLANWTAITNLHPHKVDINGKISIDLVLAGLK